MEVEPPPAGDAPNVQGDLRWQRRSALDFRPGSDGPTEGDPGASSTTLERSTYSRRATAWGIGDDVCLVRGSSGTVSCTFAPARPRR